MAATADRSRSRSSPRSWRPGSPGIRPGRHPRSDADTPISGSDRRCRALFRGHLQPYETPTVHVVVTGVTMTRMVLTCALVIRDPAGRDSVVVVEGGVEPV